MRIKEFLPESWWNDLDDNFLSMMGYSQEEEAELESTIDDLKSDVKNIRRSR